MGSKGSQTTSTSSSPNPQAMAAYQNILSQAQNVAATPYTAYSGELVAPINAQQQLGIANINNAAGYAAPVMTDALGYARSAAQPLTAEEIQRYMSPYTQGVVSATQAQFENQNEQQRQRSIGNAISQGALGGNRQAIAEAELANQQQLAQAPVIAGLYNQAYTTGLNTALTQQQAEAQAAYSLGNLGVAGQNAGLTGANAQLGAGTIEQQIKQAQDAAAYQQFVNQQAYPFQTTQWLAGIGTGVGSQMGGTSSSTAPPPNAASQWLGLGTAGLGAAGQAGLFSGLGSMFGGAGAAGAAGMGTAAGSAGLLASLGPMAMIARGGVVAPRHETMPEPPATLKLQQRQLLSGHRRVQMFPRGTPELPLPRGMNRTENANGRFHYDPRRIDENEIHRLSTAGRENDMLDLGPYSKDDIVKRMHGGEVPVAVVERHPDGTEVRAAVGTHATAERQMAAMNRSKSPGHIVRIEDPRETVGHRVRAFGGRVPGFADGGAPMEEAPPTNGVGAVMAGTPYGAGHGWIPRMDIARGRGAPAGVAPPPAAAPTPASLAQQAKEIGSLAKMIQNPGAASPEPMGADYHPSQQTWPGVDDAVYASGGSVPSGGVANLPYHLMVPHLAEGGSPYDTNYFDETFAKPIRHTQDAYDIVTSPERLSDFRDRAVNADNPSYVPTPRSRPEGIAPVYDLPPEIMLGRSRPAPEGQTALGFAGEGAARGNTRTAPRQNVEVVQGNRPSRMDNAAWPQGPVGAPGGEGLDAMAMDPGARPAPAGAPAPGGPPRGVAPASGIDFSGNSKLWPSMMAAGFGMMASKSPHLGTAVGEGGLAGMQTYATERQREDRINSEAKKLSQESSLAQKRLDLATRQFTEQSADQKARSTETARYHDIIGDRAQLKPTGTAIQLPNGELRPIFADVRRPGVAIDAITGEPVPSDAKIVPFAGGRAGGAGSSGGVSKWKHDAWLAAHPGDVNGALEYASGRKQMSAFDANKAAMTMAQRDIANNLGLTGKPAAVRDAEMKRLTEQYRTDLMRGMPATGAAPASAVAPAASPGAAGPTAPAPGAPPAAAAPPPPPPRPSTVPKDAKVQRSKSDPTKFRWLAPDGSTYSADGVKQ